MHLVPEYWTLKEGLELIRSIQGGAREYGFHVCLGGGVLNQGLSKKDLDLYFLPYESTRGRQDAPGLRKWLDGMWGKGRSLRNFLQERSDAREVFPESHPPNPDSKDTIYSSKRKYRYSDLRIDVFVVGGEREEEGEEDQSDPMSAKVSGGINFTVGEAWGASTATDQPQPTQTITGSGGAVVTFGTYAGITRSDTPAWHTQPIPSPSLPLSYYAGLMARAGAELSGAPSNPSELQRALEEDGQGRGPGEPSDA